MMKKFLRGKWRTYSKLGRGRKKKLKYRRPKGRHNKIREKKKGNPKKVEIGYKKQKSKEEKIKIIRDIKELSEVERGEKIIIGKLGQKKKIEAANKAKEKNIIIVNLNIEKFLKKIEREKKGKKEQEEKKEKIEKEKREEIKEKNRKEAEKEEEGKEEQIDEEKENEEKKEKIEEKKVDEK